MSFVLKPHPSVQNPKHQVAGTLKLEGRRLHWTMEVTKPASLDWITDSRFGSDPRKNWELWNFDVVETFLQLRRHAQDIHAPYLELQVSPLGQALQLIILKPRVSFYTPLSLEFQAHTRLLGNQWMTEVQVELPQDFPQGELWGGMFACLGSTERGFYSLSPNPEAKPDFHRPELFEKL